MTTTMTRPRLFTGAVLRLFAIDFAAMSGFYLLLSVVPGYSADRGIGSAGAGLSTGVLMFASVAGELAGPGLAARLGYRRLLMVGLILLGAPALALPAVTGLGTLLAVSAVRGLGFAIVVVIVSAMAAAAIPAQRRGEGMGALGVVAMLPAVAALPLGVWLAGRCGYVAVFVAAAALPLSVIPLVARLPDGARGGEGHGHERCGGERHGGERHGGLRAVLRRPAVLRPTLVFAATAVGGGVVVAFLPGAVTGAVAAPALLVQSATATLARWLAGRYSDRCGAAVLLAPAVVVSAIGMGMAACTGNNAAVVSGMAVFGAGFGMAQSASMNTMLRHVPPSSYAAVSAAWNGAYDLGWGTGAIGIGMVVSVAGYPAAFGTAAVVVLAALPLARLPLARPRAQAGPRRSHRLPAMSRNTATLP